MKYFQLALGGVMFIFGVITTICMSLSFLLCLLPVIVSFYNYNNFLFLAGIFYTFMGIIVMNWSCIFK